MNRTLFKNLLSNTSVFSSSREYDDWWAHVTGPVCSWQTRNQAKGEGVLFECRRMETDQWGNQSDIYLTWLYGHRRTSGAVTVGRFI